MNPSRSRGLAIAILASAVLTSACGLKPEVKDALAQNPGLAAAAGGGQIAVDTDGDGTVDSFTTDPGTGAGTTTTTDGTTTGGTGSTGSGTTTGSTGSGTTGSGTSTGSTGGGTGTTGGAAAPAADEKGTTTGIDFDKKVIKIALHGPLTGAGVPQDSFRSGTPKYWNEGPGGQPRKLKNGFTVEAVAIDDKYNAPDALRACNAAAKQYFLIVGGAGADQIQACAQSQVLTRGNVPYLSAGVTENGLGKLPNYFATSPTYREQSPMIVQMAKDNNFFSGKWAIVITEGPNFADALNSMKTELQKAGAKFNPSSDVFLTDKSPSNCSAIGNQVRAGAYNTIYFLGQPAFFAQCVGVIGPGPTYTGPGPAFATNSIVNLACSSSGNQYKGFYLHPGSGLDQAGQRAKGVQFKDDIEYLIYAAMAQIENAFNQVPGNLTREKFISTLRNSAIPDLISPGASYKGGVRFGGKASFALQAKCGGSPQSNQSITKKQYNK